MKLSEISIKRPVLATVLSLTILLFGIVSFYRLPVREYPDIESPIVSVTTFYRGASPQVVETEVTDVVEEALSTLEGVKLITSESREQGSVVVVEFNINRDVDEAANDVRDRVSRIRGQLPSTVDDPIVAKRDVNAQPIIWLALFGERYNTLELSDFARNVLAERIQRLEGVGSVFVGGAREYAMRIWIDPQRLAAHGLTVSDLEAVLRAENLEIPSGRVEGRGREFAVRTRGDLSRADEFANIVVAQQGGSPVRLGDVANVTLGAEDERTVVRFNGEPTVGVGIIKTRGASTVAVSNRVHDALPGLRNIILDGMNLRMAYDSSTFIKDAIDEVLLTLLIAMVLVVAVIFLFLGNLRATIIPAVAIPVSLIGTFTVTYFLGFTMNILTLLALVLAIGLVVDDAIIMLENIHRHIEMGKSRRRAALEGASEIGFAIVATTLTLVAVFIPVAFLTGRIGRLFNEFGVVVAFSVLISGFVALSLTPMLCSRMLKRHRVVPVKEGADGGGNGDDLAATAAVDAEEEAEAAATGYGREWFDKIFRAIDQLYAHNLRWFLKHRRVVVLVALGVVASIAVMFRILPSELVPTEDRGLVFNIIFAPEGSTLEYTDRYVRRAEEIYKNVPEVDRQFSAIGLGFGGPGRVTDAFIFAGLKPYDQRKRSQQEIVASVFPQLLSIPGVMAIAVNPPSLGGGFGRPVQFVLQAETYDDLQNAVGVMMRESQKLGYLVNMDTNLKLNKPQLEVRIDRDRAAELGVSVAEIGTTLQTLLGGREVTRFKRGNEQYEVMLQAPRWDRSSPGMIEGLYVRGTNGLVQLASVVSVEEVVSPRALNHFNRVRSATLSANLAPGHTIGDAVTDLEQVAQRELPPDVRTDLAGESREFVESSGGLYFLFLIALVFIYLVLAAQFESFVHPFTILLSVPLAVFGAMMALWVFGMSLNIYSQIGLIMLIGLVTKNSILIVEYSNQRRSRGEPLIDAVVSAARIRLRPILMTTMSTVFGVLPIALGLGAGAESRKPLGAVVVAGMLFSMFFTLIMVPVVYTLLARFAGDPLKKTVEKEAPEALPAPDTGAPEPA
jgi:multidrug efflux pump